LGTISSEEKAKDVLEEPDEDKSLNA